MEPNLVSQIRAPNCEFGPLMPSHRQLDVVELDDRAACRHHRPEDHPLLDLDIHIARDQFQHRPGLLEAYS